VPIEKINTISEICINASVYFFIITYLFFLTIQFPPHQREKEYPPEHTGGRGRPWGGAPLKKRRGVKCHYFIFI
jgi:hypothetical protein